MAWCNYTKSRRLIADLCHRGVVDALCGLELLCCSNDSSLRFRNAYAALNSPSQCSTSQRAGFC